MPQPDPKSRDPFPERAQIWIEGQQQPRFKWRAFVVVGHDMARLWLVPLMDRAGLWLKAQGQHTAEGRYRIGTAWMGRGERFVPSAATLGAMVTGLAARVAQARAILQPPPVAPLVPPLSSLRPQRPTATPAADPSLAAIRAAIHSAPTESPAPDPAPQVHPAPLRGVLALCAAHAIAWTSLALAMPVGLVRAAIYHLDGGDLANWN